ncbi:MAG: hypothetical protein M3R17_04945 [Bacteroidota bacterium]|nr:hypothetical protein [Bacteroidota bacterium]
MKPFSHAFAIIVLAVLAGLTACNNSEKGKQPDTINAKNGFDTTNKIANVSVKKDSVSIWIYDYMTDLPIKNRSVNADTLTPGKLVEFINTYKGGSAIHLDFIKVERDTIYVKIKESTFLTQRMGTYGANEYLCTTTFTLTELKGVKNVNFDFEEGDHAVPGTYNRKYYIDKTSVIRK